MKTALITALGSVAVDITIKSLKRLGFRIVGTDVFPKEWNADSFNVDVFYRVPYVRDQKEYLAAMKEICKKENVTYILPMIDDEVHFYNENREWFDENQITLCISPKEALDIVRNKKVLADFISEKCSEIASIPTLYVRDVKELPWEFPVVCKPYNGRSSQGRVYIHNQAEWESYLETFDHEYSIVEPFIHGCVVLVELVRSEKFDKCVAITRQELIRTPHGCATSVKMFQDKSIEERSCKLARELNINGCVNFEYILDDNGEYHFIECNPRFSAGAEFSYLTGYELVENHMRCFEGKNIDDYQFKHNMIIARKYEEYITKIWSEE